MTESPALPESNVFIPMRDGVRLAATLYLPETAGPWPALLEAYPYRKDERGGLKAEPDSDLPTMGSGELMQTLIPRGRPAGRPRAGGLHHDRGPDRGLPPYEKRCGNWWMMPVLSMSAMPRISRSTRS
jgi:X-Pro dipeptidyl-peptidase (S15 family)